MNLKLEPFTDLKVREAFAYAFDRETHCTEVRSGDCTPALSWIPPGTPGHIETDQIAFNPEVARQALAASSYGGPVGLPDIHVYYNADRSGATERAEWIAGQYRDILGIALLLEPIDGATLISLTKDNATHPQLVLTGGWAQHSPDPQNWLSVYWTCAASLAQQLGYCHEELNRRTGVGGATVDPAQRIAHYERAGQLLIGDKPGPFAFHLIDVFVVNPAVTGFTPMASETQWPGQCSALMTLDKTE